MLKRKMMDELQTWHDSPSKKAFVLLGARQTGKTFTIRQFGATQYDDMIEVNFIESESDGAFLSGASSAQDLLSRLSLIAGRSIQPGTLIFFDEVQHLGHSVVSMAKFIVEDGRFDLVLSGSFLGAELNGIASFPVGYSVVRTMRPLDFEEFCWAMNVPSDILDSIMEHYRDRRPLEDAMHTRLTQLFRRYIVVGGMPEAVQAFVDGGQSLGAARGVCMEIVPQYRYDITKYAARRKLQILSIFDNIPSQLAKENKRFMMQSVKEGLTFARLKDDFSWIEASGVGLATYVVTEPRFPLQRTEVREKFKLYASDCGLLLAQYPQAFAMQIIDGAKDVNYGAIYENVVAQELAAARFPLRYYHNSRKGEVDFLVETSEGKVLPIEIKSGKSYQLHTALNNLLSSDGFDVDCAYVLSEANVSVGERQGKPVYYLPLYMTLCLKTELDDDLGLQGVQPIQL